MMFCLSLLVYITFVESNHNHYYNNNACYKTNFDFYGHDLHITDALSYYACQDICLKDWDCKFFTFSIKLQKCWLKDKVIFVRQSEDRISGPKSCRGHRGVITICQEKQLQDENIYCHPTTRAFLFEKKGDEYCCLDNEGISNSNCNNDVENLHCKGPTLCEKKRLKDKLQCGSHTNCLKYVTQCESDGSFKATQSDDAKSWCVNILSGLKIKDSEHHKEEGADPCTELNKCWTAAKERRETCDSKTSTREKYECLITPDTRPPKCHKDGKVKSKECDIVSDGRTFCWCVDSAGSVIDGTFTDMRETDQPFDCKIPPVCIGRRDEQIEALTNINLVDTKDEYIPQCRKDDRSFKLRQCHGGLCWCVDAVGNKLENTDHSLAKKFDCIKCEEKRKIQMDECTDEDCFLFTCMSSGRLYSPKQCHSSICWCVDRWGNIIKGSYQNKDTDFECPNFNICPNKKGMACEMSGAFKAKQEKGLVTFYVDSEGNGVPIVRTPCQDKVLRDTEKCNNDPDCHFMKCDAATGKFMREQEAHQQQGKECLDSDLRPSHIVDSLNPCPEFTKCQQNRLEHIHGECFGKSSSKCYIPQCEDDGQFNPQQCKGSVCWCVNVNGEQTEGIHEAKDNTDRGYHQHGHYHREFTCRKFTDCEKRYAKEIQECISTNLVDWPKCTIIRCSADGEYEPTQCQGGMCWCVDPNNGDSLETNFLISDKSGLLGCTGGDSTLDCIQQKKLTNYLDCDEFGYFKPLQCAEDDNCWCVDPLGKKLEMPERISSPKHALECMQLPKDKNNKPRSCNGRCIYFYDNLFDDHIHNNPSHLYDSNMASLDSNYGYLFPSYDCACDPGCVDRNNCCRDYRRTCLY